MSNGYEVRFGRIRHRGSKSAPIIAVQRDAYTRRSQTGSYDTIDIATDLRIQRILRTKCRSI